MSKKNKRNICLMKNWPSDETLGVPFEDLIFPVKKIVLEGYRMERLPIKQFTYTGYNIGEPERLYYPSPVERFTTRWLTNDEKFKRTLLDNALQVAFQLGMEQGRRLDKYKRYNNDLLVDIIHARTRTIRRLQAQLSEYEETANFSCEVPLESADDQLMIENMEAFDDVDARDAKED